MIADEYAALWPRAVTVAQRRGARDPENVAAEALLRCWQAEQRGTDVRHGYVQVAVCNETITERRRRWTTEVTLGDWGAAAVGFDDSDPDGVLALLRPEQADLARLLAAGWRVYELSPRLGLRADTLKKRRYAAQRRLREAGYG